VILLEKHYMTGGLCSSFTRGAYYFDAGAHYLGSCRPEGQIGRLLHDLQLEKRLTLLRCDPSDVIISKGHEVYIRSDVGKTIHEFQSHFKTEADSIRKFFNYVVNTEPILLYLELKDATFKSLLDAYFSNWELKSILSTMLGNIGLPSSRASALSSVFLFREFVLDGGYYPKGGIQRLPDALLAQFEEFGGITLLLSPAEEIGLDSAGRVRHVTVRQMGRHPIQINTRCVVANCDPFQLYGKLLQKNANLVCAKPEYQNRVSTMSAFMVYLGVKKDISTIAKYHCNLWSYRRGHVDEYFEGVLKDQIDTGLDSFLFCSIPSFHDENLLPPDRHSLQLIVAAPFRERSFWEEHKDAVADAAIDRLEQYIPGLRQWIEVKEVATPPTIVKYTANYRGAMYGWASIPVQVGRRAFPQETAVEGLFSTGHWTGIPSGHSGVPTVVTSGRVTARLVLRWLRENKGLVFVGPACSLPRVVRK